MVRLGRRAAAMAGRRTCGLKKAGRRAEEKGRVQGCVWRCGEERNCAAAWVEWWRAAVCVLQRDNNGAQRRWTSGWGRRKGGVQWGERDERDNGKT